MSDVDLLSLGVGQGSKNERLKAESAHLRGNLAAELIADTSHFGESELQLLKFHGSYQQEDRDQRPARKAAKEEPAYQFMVRSRIPGGVLTAEQYLMHDDIATRYGSESLRLTTRQGIQLHGIVKTDLRATIKQINDALISTLAACGDVNRNVMACPAPTAARSHALVQEYAHRIAMHLEPHTTAYHEIWLDGERIPASELSGGDDEPIYGQTYLPRKFKIGIAFPDDNCVDIYTQDIGLVAELRDDALVGFTLVVGGGMGSTNGKSETTPVLAVPLCFARPDEVVEIAEAIVTIQRDYGNRQNRKQARMKYLIRERGIAWFRSELETRLGRPVEDPHVIRFWDVEDHLGWHAQASGLSFLGLYIENGRVSDTPTRQLRSALREAIERFRPGVRITGQQNILLTGIADAQRIEVEELLRNHGVESEPERLGLRRHAMACPAMPTCGLAVAEAERAMAAIVSEIERELVPLDLQNEKLSIRITGCPNGCARPRMGDIGIVGRSLNMYDIYIGGDWQNTRLNSLFAQAVKRNVLASTLRRPLELWKQERLAEEGFGDFADRYGINRLTETLIEQSAQ